MVEYVTRSKIIEIGRQNLSENLQKVIASEKRNPNGTTFLSHSSKDDEVMPGVVAILENHGATVYLDKKDPTLINKNPQEIAQSLRTKISLARKFMLFASVFIKDSKWVPWELGLADGFKRSNSVAIFPAPDKQTETEWTEQEYLGIYERVVWGQFSGKTHYEWMVWNHRSNSATALAQWLNS